jgi:extradiol dioxygenase family protein
VRHFGVVLDLATWESLAQRFKAAGVAFVVEPYVRFRGESGEQATMFFLDRRQHRVQSFRHRRAAAPDKNPGIFPAHAR